MKTNNYAHHEAGLEDEIDVILRLKPIMNGGETALYISL